MDSIGLKIGAYMRVNHGSLSICVKSSSANPALCSASIEKSNWQDNQFAFFSFSEGFSVRAGDKLLFTVKDQDSPGSHSKGQVAVYVAEGLSSPVAYEGVRYK